jgi:hypothetical protein
MAFYLNPSEEYKRINQLLRHTLNILVAQKYEMSVQRNEALAEVARLRNIIDDLLHAN